MSGYYVDNAENRKLGRVGMPKGSMPVSKVGGTSPNKGQTVRSTSSQQAQSPGTYVDNAENRRRGRVGMPKGSMPVSKGISGGHDGNISDIKGQTVFSQNCQQAQSPGTYVDNAENRRLGRVGMPKGSMPVSKGTSGGHDGNISDIKGQTVRSTSSQQAQSPGTYVDNAENRRLGRVGMPKGSMPVSKGTSGGHDGNISDIKGQTVFSQSSQQPQSPGTYVDNAENRRRGRVGMPKGSMPVSKGTSGGHDGNISDIKGQTVFSQNSQQAQSPGTYVDNAENRRLGRVGMPKGSMPVSKGTSGGHDGNISDIKGQTVFIQNSQHAQSPGTYVDNAENRRLGRVGMPKGSMSVSKGDGSSFCNKNQGYTGTTMAFDHISEVQYESITYNGLSALPIYHSLRHNVDPDSGAGSKVHFDNRQKKSPGRNGNPYIEAVGCSNDHESPAAANRTRVYIDNPLNRRLGRVGLPVGTVVFSSVTKNVEQRNYEDTSTNRKLNRVGKPRGCYPLQNKSSTTRKIPEMLRRIENEDEFSEYVFEDRTTCNGDLEFGLVDSSGTRIKAFDQALYRYNRQEAEHSWQRTNTTKEPPKTQVSILKEYTGKKIYFDELKLHKVIGKGGFGMVYFAKWNDTVVAVKKLQNEKISNSRIKDFAKEIMNFCALSHDNIVKFIGACDEKSNLCIVMEYMQMTLYDAIHIRNDTDFNETEQIVIIRQVCEGMNYLHSKRIVHCDLKSSNVLLDYVKDEICEVKITDFGLSMIMHDTSVSVDELVKNIGTPQYSPPEMLRGEILSAKDMMRADVYSLALIFLEVIFREEPFPDYSYQDLKKRVGDKGDTPEIPENPVIDQDIKDIMQQAWKYIPTERPSVITICQIFKEKYKLYIN